MRGRLLAVRQLFHEIMNGFPPANAVGCECMHSTPRKREILNASFMRCSRPLITWREQDLEGGPKVGEALMPFTKFIFVVKFYLRRLARRRVYGLRSVLGGRNCRVWSTILKAILSMACYADKKWMHGGVARSRPP